jgi:hypothetical protein
VIAIAGADWRATSREAQSTWRRLHRMRRIDSAAFLATAAAVLTTNAVAAVAIGCALYVGRHIAIKLAGFSRLPAIGPRKVDS